MATDVDRLLGHSYEGEALSVRFGRTTTLESAASFLQSKFLSLRHRHPERHLGAMSYVDMHAHSGTGG